jgi:membrane protein DedA with SNARE-associated domain/membrane-associated phospholipid phosphatase
MEHIQPYLDYFSAHPGWALAIIFLVALGEALLVIGLFVPSTAVLVGAGILVGAGSLEFWPVYIATTVGCIVGDQISYWAGKIYGDKLRGLWPLSRYPALMAKGEDFVKLHGGKSIAIGRFVPGVKAVVPGIVGMLGMSQMFFLVVNISSGAVWSIAHLLPGILIGQGLALAGEVSGRLALVLVVLLGILFVAGWLIRIIAAGLAPYARSVLARISNWARGSRYRPLVRLGQAIDPDHHRSTTLAAFLVIGVLCLVGLADLTGGLMVRDQVSNLDLSVATLMQEWRNAPADELMIVISMLADHMVMWLLGLTMVAWLFVWRAWRAGMVALGILLAGEFLSRAMGFVFSRGSPIAGIAASDGSFPSSQVLLSGLVFGMLAVVAGHSIGRWSRAVIAAGAGVFAFAVGFARIYLGADWLSGVLGGLLLAALLCAVFGTVIEAVPSRRIKPLGLGVVATLVFLSTAAFHVNLDYDAAEKTYAAPVSTQVFAVKDWVDGKWLQQPARRIDMSGRVQEVFVLQWAGSLDGLQTQLEKQGWKATPKWRWRDMLAYLNLKTPLADAPPRPLLHQGLAARLTLVRVGAGQDKPLDGRRMVVRVYKTQAALTGDVPVFLVSLTAETLNPKLDLYAIPKTLPATELEVSNLVQDVEGADGMTVLVKGDDVGKPRAVVAAAP